MRLFVAGGAGFIGSTFVRAAVAAGHEVTVFDALTYRGHRENLDGVPHDFVRGDIGDPDALDAALPGHEVVVNFANGSFVDRSIRNPDEFVHANVLGTATLVEAVRRHSLPKLLHVSTDEVYGSIDAPGRFTPEHRLDPSSPYSATKAAGDVYCLAAFKTYGTPVLLTRLCNVYGLRQHPENFIPRFVTNLLDGLPAGLYGDGLNVREWLWVGDAAEGILRVLESGRPGAVYHLGSGVERDNRAVAERLVELCGASLDQLTYVADRPGHDRRYRLDLTATEEELGWRARADFDEKLAETVSWYRDHRSWWEPLVTR